MYKHEDGGDIAECFYTLEEIENGVHHLHLETLGHRWFLANRRQYTGLKDKNGKEIYEGDVLFTDCCDSDYMPERVQTVVSDTECSGSLIFRPITGASLCESNQEYFEIIGNIYENPELVNDDA